MVFFPPRRRAALLGLLVLGAACTRPPETPLVRLGAQVAVSGPDVVVPIDRDLVRPIDVPVGRDAAAIGGVRLRIAGKANAVALNWRRAGEHGLVTGRRLVLVLDPTGAERTYQVDLSREQQWAGEITSLRLLPVAGAAHVVDVTLQHATAALRPVSLRGETLPSLPARGRLAIPITPDMPRRARFEARVGVLPEFQRLGARACFSVAVADWLSSQDPAPVRRVCVQTNAASVQGWQPVAVELELPRKGRLVLDASIEADGHPLELGAVWGDPVLVGGTRAPGPNLVLVVVDTVRADRLGVYGNRDGLTPNLDAFAGRAVRLAELRSPAPWTLPSMGSLMTGLEPQTHGGGQRLGNEAPTGIADGLPTLAETLAARGFYSTGIYKNIYLNPAFGLNQGFDDYAAHETLPGPAGEELEANAGFLVDRAIDELARVRDRRFFLYLHLFDPHNPYEPPAAWCESVARRLAPTYRGPLGCRADRRPEEPMPAASDVPWIRALYDAEIAYTDHELGRFFAALRDSGLDSNTVIAFVSDHGEEFYERADAERARGYEPNSDHGHSLYDELLHVPAMIQAPGLAPGVLTDPVPMVDLFPTLLSLVGVPAPTNEGTDLSAALAGAGRADGPHPPAVPLVADVILHGSGRAAVRRGHWKLIRPAAGPGAPELYDLDADPGETTDVAAAHPDVVLALRRLLARELDARRKLRTQLLSSDSVRSTFLDWGHITKLRSLGYLR